MSSLQKGTNSCIWCPNCGRIYHRANRLNALLNISLAVAVFALGSVGASYGLGK